MCTRKGYAASVSQLALATAALYFPFFKAQPGSKRFAAQPQTIYSEFPYRSSSFFQVCRYSKAWPRVPASAAIRSRGSVPEKRQMIQLPSAK